MLLEALLERQARVIETASVPWKDVSHVPGVGIQYPNLRRSVRLDRTLWHLHRVDVDHCGSIGFRRMASADGFNRRFPEVPWHIDGTNMSRFGEVLYGPPSDILGCQCHLLLNHCNPQADAYVEHILNISVPHGFISV